MLIRKLEPGDAAAARAFFERIPDAIGASSRRDVFDPETLSRWIGDSRVRRLVLIDEEGDVRGCASVVPGIGWSAHIAELRVIVDPSARRHGLGSQLVWKAPEVSR
jgi:hypothetical protein